MSDLTHPASVEPTTLRAGDSIAWTRGYDAYLATAGWSLAYRLLWSTGYLDISTTASGAEFAAVIAATSSASIPAGRATLIGTVTKGAERQTVYQGPVTVLANLAIATAFDDRSQAVRALADAKAALAAYTADGNATVEAYTIAGRSMKFRTAADLIKLIERLERDVVAERNAAALAAGGAPGRIVTRNR